MKGINKNKSLSLTSCYGEFSFDFVKVMLIQLPT